MMDLSPLNPTVNLRNHIPGLMFHKAVQMLLVHELAHIGCGHLDLQAVDPEFGNDINTKCPEQFLSPLRSEFPTPSRLLWH